MPRLMGVDIPNDKRIEYAITYIYGIGHKTGLKILKKCKIDLDKRAKDLTESELAQIRKAIDELKIPIEGELRRIVSQNIKRLQEIRCYRGERHIRGLPVRGQSTKRNARTRKGKRKTVSGAQKKAVAKK